MPYLLDIPAVMASTGRALRIELADHESAPTTPWAGAMLLLQALRAHNEGGLDQGVARELRPPLALLDPTLRQRLSEHERAQTAQLSGSCLITLPSMAPAQNPVLTALCSLIGARLQQLQLHIVVRHLVWMDVESMQLIEHLITNEAGSRLHLSVADPELLHSSVASRHDGDGLDAERARRLLLVRRVASISEACESPLSARKTVRPVARPRRRLSSTGSPPSTRLETATDLQVLAAGMRHAVTCHAFSVALSFAERLLVMDGADADLQQEAALAAAVSAHNLAPHDAAFSTLAADYFAQLASRSSDPALRSHGCFRLCLHEAQHRGRLAQALVLAEEAIRHARDDSIDTDRVPLYLAWAYGGRAFVQSRMARFAEAAQSCSLALDQLHTERPRHPAIPQAALADATAQLQQMAARIHQAQ